MRFKGFCRNVFLLRSSVVALATLLIAVNALAQQPNIIIIYSDDVGYGDLGVYGNRSIPTPHMDALANSGLRFTNAYTTAATCTPSRYSLLTGRYNWRQQGTGVARGNAGLIIDTALQTLPEALQQAGYTTGMIGKWHLGLGGAKGPDWNGIIAPGVLESGFHYAWYMPSTNDRVPTVFIENKRVVRLSPTDPITVSYDAKIGNEPTGKDNPELLTMRASHGHNNTIINGIGRIGFMSGGISARWRDPDIADTLLTKAQQFIAASSKPFFLYFNPHDIHCPRTPHERFAGKSGYGLRGDALLELDWTVGELVRFVDSLSLRSNTLIVYSSDNGPVVDDGYEDQSKEQLGNHKPWGPLRGGKYSIFEAGTRVPIVASWPGRIEAGTSSALFSQVDLFASLAALTGATIQPGQAIDSRNHLPALLGNDKKGRNHVVINAHTTAIRQGNWKYIKPANGSPMMKDVNIETGVLSADQLYNLKQDPGERNNLASKHPRKVQELQALLSSIMQGKGDGSQ
jgi:arylsulfatase A-like enzyme